LQSEIALNIPRPTIHSVTNVLNSMEKKYQDSFPYSKWGQVKDDYSFNRVKPAIMELKGAILDYAAHFTSTEEFPTTTFSFLHLATSITQRLPDWENHLHNEIKRDLYIKLAEYWTKAIVDAASKVSEGKIYGQMVVSEWARKCVFSFLLSFRFPNLFFVLMKKFLSQLTAWHNTIVNQMVCFNIQSTNLLTNLDGSLVFKLEQILL
jgi:hypothetical protein